MDHRHIIFVPGKNPKPVPAVHRELLWRTLIEGITRVNPACAAELQHHENNFSLIAWNFIYYFNHSNIELELPWIEKLLQKTQADATDIREAENWHLKLNWLLYSVADLMPFIISLLPAPASATVRETRRYFNNSQNIGSKIREPLKQQLRTLLDRGEKALVIAHSLGTVIAFDALWELTHLEQRDEKIDLITLGSPLGMNFVQHRMLGNTRTGADQYTANIRHWTNISARGDITALDTDFRDQFKSMLKLGLVESITDHHKDVYNWYRNAAGLNVHRSYGYLTNDVVARTIVNWWHANA